MFQVVLSGAYCSLIRASVCVSPDKQSTMLMLGFALVHLALLVTPLQGLSTAVTCSKAEATKYASLFVKNAAFNTSCPPMHWLNKLEEILDASSEPLTFFDIGCNKGFTSAKFFGLFAEDVAFKPTEVLSGEFDEQLCGACRDCEEEIMKKTSILHDRVDVYCFEPSHANLQFLLQLKSRFFPTTGRLVRKGVQWHILNMAAYNSSSFAPFPDCKGEGCSLAGTNLTGGDNRQRFTWVPTTTVDRFVQEVGIRNLTLLKIDAEGYDPAVLKGAMRSIRTGVVKLITFEYNKGVWLEYKLEDFVDWFDEYGFICYFDGVFLTRLTGCWFPRFEFYSWANVVCVHREHPLLEYCESLSTRLAKNVPSSLGVRRGTGARPSRWHHA